MNWGNKLLVTFIVFGLGMGYLVYRSVNTNFELVEKDYYKNELSYQQVIDAANRANELNSSLQLTQSASGILLQLPEEMKNKAVSGTILFYCAYDKNKDISITLQTDAEAKQQIPLTSVEAGTYTVKINWACDGKAYYFEKNLKVL
jgi:hypothetical protein